MYVYILNKTMPNNQNNNKNSTTTTSRESNKIKESELSYKQNGLKEKI